MENSHANSSAEDPFLARLAAAADLAPTVGSGRHPVTVTIDGQTYDGITAVPLEDLAMCSAADYAAMRPAQRSHRSRRLMPAPRLARVTYGRGQGWHAAGPRSGSAGKGRAARDAQGFVTPERARACRMPPIDPVEPDPTLLRRAVLGRPSQQHSYRRFNGFCDFCRLADWVVYLRNIICCRAEAPLRACA